MNLCDDIKYWVAKCASLQQEVDVLNEKLANASVIKWQTGEPTKTGRYLIYTIDDGMQFDNWSTFLKQWSTYYNNEVTAWCKLSDIEPYKNKEETK